MNYKIIYKNPTQQYLFIEATFDCKNNNEITLQFPSWRPGRYELGNFAKNVKNLQVKTENNRLVPANKIGKDQWLVECENVDEILVSYQYYAHELNAGSSYMDESQLYVNPVNCLIYDTNKMDEPCTLALDIPANYKIATGAKIDNNTLKCTSFHELVDSPFIASPTLQHSSYQELGIEFHIWVQGSTTFEWEKVINDFSRFTRKQLEMFSNRREKFVGFPTKNYHFLFQILPEKAYHGVEHTTSTVIALGPEKEIMSGRYDDFLGVSSHELYHVWNVKTIRPIEMYPYNYAAENYSYLGYVAEGVTTYLGDVFLALSGVKDFYWYQKEFELLLQKHFDNTGRFNYSVAESSWDTWLDGYIKGAPGRKVSIYTEGALLAFIIDMKIRFNTQNKSSIHNVMNDLYQEYALKNKGYSEEDYLNIVKRYVVDGIDDLFKNQIHGCKPYESVLVQALDSIGFSLEMEQNPSHSERILGVKTIEENNQVIITDIFPGGSGELGALMIGDVICAINNITLKDTFDKALEPYIENPLTLEVSRMGRALTIVCPNTNRSMYPIYKIKPKKTPSNLNKRIFKSWIGTSFDEIK